MPTVTRTIKVLKEAQITLSVEIGNGQAGGIAAFLGPNLECHAPRELHEPLGSGATLIDEVLVISTTAVDIRPETNRVSVTTTLGGIMPAQPPIVQEVDVAQGGAVNFLTVISFVDGAE